MATSPLPSTLTSPPHIERLRLFDTPHTPRSLMFHSNASPQQQQEQSLESSLRHPPTPTGYQRFAGGIRACLYMYVYSTHVHVHVHCIVLRDPCTLWYNGSGVFGWHGLVQSYVGGHPRVPTLIHSLPRNLWLMANDPGKISEVYSIGSYSASVLYCLSLVHQRRLAVLLFTTRYAIVCRILLLRLLYPMIRSSWHFGITTSTAFVRSSMKYVSLVLAPLAQSTSASTD